MQDDKTFRRRWWTLGVLSIALFAITIDNTILNVALPTIQRELGADGTQLQWIVDAYTLVFAGLLLTAGALGDRFGRRGAFAAGLVIFGAGSLWSAFAGSANELIVSRALMGIGGAFIMPTTLSIATNVFPKEERGKAIGIWAAVAGLGVALGPLTGGWLIENADWTWVFLINVPIVIGALIAIPALIPTSKDPAQPKLDPIGCGLSIVGLSILIWSIIEGGDKGWTGGPVLAGFAISVLLLAAFAAWELRREQPMLDIRLFKVKAFTGASMGIGLAFFALFGTIFFLTQYLQDVMDLSAFDAGLRTSPVALGLVIGGPVSAKLAARFGARPVVTTGLTVLALGLFLMSGVQVDSGYGTVLSALLVMGFGMGLTMAPATESIMSSLPVEHAGVGSAMNDTLRELGGTLGVAILGSLLTSGYRGDMDAATEGLPAGAQDAAGEGLGNATAVAENLGGSAGRALDAAAETAFTGAMGSALTIASLVALAGAAFAFTVIPGRERVQETEPALEPAPA